MTKTEIQHLMKELGVAPGKKLGQNFLIDNQFIDWLIRYAKVVAGEPVIEVGPGFGALTDRLMAAKVKLTAIELDRKLAAYIRKTYCPAGLNLIEGDACKVKYAEIFGPETDFRLVSNLPYSAGTVVVAKMLDLPLPPKEMIIMLQKEVAERFIAAPDSENYSALTARIQTIYDGKIVRTIPPDLFFPRPEIDSAIIHLVRRPDFPDANTRKVFSQLTRVSFAQRRKKMLKQAASVFGRENVEQAMTLAGVDLNVRAEVVTPAQFMVMTKYLLEHATVSDATNAENSGHEAETGESAE